MTDLLSQMYGSKWHIMDVFNFLFWLIFDSWRKPNIELFVRLSPEEATKVMINACNESISIAEPKNEQPITGYFGKSYFSLLKWSDVPFGRVAVIYSTILYGKIHDVKQGVYIQAWHRLPTLALVLFGLWLGAMTVWLFRFTFMPDFLPNSAYVALVIIAAIGWELFLLWFGKKIAYQTKKELRSFVGNTFFPD